MIEFSRYTEAGRAVMFVSRFGEALAEQREVAGYEKQGEAANASAKLASEYPDLFQPFSQQWLSRLESDMTGDHIKKSQPLKLLALAYLLKLDSAEFYERIGVHIAPVPLRETLATSGRSPIPPVVPPIDVPLYVPAELQQLIDTYGDQPGYEALKNPKAVRALAAQRAYLGHEDGPQTVAQWQEYFWSMQRWLPK